jgi:rod shape determining protein RodA
MFDRRLAQNFDWLLFCLTLIMAGIGLVVLYSAVTAGTQTGAGVLFNRQLMWYGIGLGVMVISFFFDYKYLDKFAPAIYVGTILLLVMVKIDGIIGGGSRRWLLIGPIYIQPSEVAKLVVIIVLARYYAKVPTSNGYTLRELIKPMMMALVPFALIALQPDLGTAILLGLIAAAMTVFAGIERRTFLALGATCASIVPIAWVFLMKDYQKQRVLTLLNPDRDPLGAGYHIIQSKIAIGSGMLFGKGFLKGTQNALSFLPEQHTDFIFSVLAEEWGFLGSAIVIAVFFLLIICGLRIAYGCRDIFGMMIAVGVTGMLFWQVVINISMVMGMMPVVGVPLPFVSYGGSSIVMMMLSVGLLINIRMRRFMFE